MTDRTISSGKPLLQSVPLTSNLDSELITNAQRVRVLIRLIFRFFGQNESHVRYKPVKVGLQYTVVSNAEVSLHTNTSRKGRVASFSFSRVNLSAGCTLFKCVKNSPAPVSLSNTKKSVVYITNVLFGCFIFGEQTNSWD